jgi:hypothetical protein
MSGSCQCETTPGCDTVCERQCTLNLLHVFPPFKPRTYHAHMKTHSLTTLHEARTFMFAKGTFGVFLAPKNTWIYGQLQHNIGWTHEDDCGTFVLDNGSVNTHKWKDVVKANDRIVKGNLFADYRNGLDKGKQQIAEARQKLESKVGDRGEDEAEGNLHALMKASQTLFRLGNPVKVPRSSRRQEASVAVGAPVALVTAQPETSLLVSEVCEDNVLEASVDVTSATPPDVMLPLYTTAATQSDTMKDDCSLAAEQSTVDKVVGGKKREKRSDDDTDETTDSDRKFMQVLAASVSKMEQQFTMLLETRPQVNPYQRGASDAHGQEDMEVTVMKRVMWLIWWTPQIAAVRTMTCKVMKQRDEP